MANIRSPLFALCLSATAVLGGAAAYADDLEFELINKTGVKVTEFYLSATSVNNWEENLLSESLGGKSKITVTVNDGRRTCSYDILAVFADGDKVEDRKVNLCELGSYTLHN